MLVAEPLSEHARISLLTCHPGEELYECYGHTAIRVVDPEWNMDIVFNYGLFSFETDHFYYKFVKGETWYQLGVENTDNFVWYYRNEERDVCEQELALSPEEGNRLWEALVTNYEPQNRSYLYNFVFDNCATRPYHMILRALDDSIQSTYTGAIGQTYRAFLSRYTGVGTWADFGINLLFGRRADRVMQGTDALFLPEELMHYMSAAKRADGRPIIVKEHTSTFAAPKTPWYKTWYFGLSVATLILLLITLLDRHRGRLSWWIDAILIFAMIIVLGIVVFLTFFSIHPLVGFGWRLLIIPTLHLCARLPFFIR